jgi:F-box protein 21
MLTKMKISRRLAGIVGGIRGEHHGIDERTPRQRALAIAQYLRDHDLTGIAEGSEYHDIRHNFLGIALLDENHSSLPLISVAMYCYIAQRFGLDAHPCGFPFHVHAVIHPSPELDMDGNPRGDDVAGEPMYMDPFRSAQETPASYLRSQLDIMGTLPAAREIFLGQASISEIVLRCGRNIWNSVQPANPIVVTANLYDSNIPDSEGAFYAALWASLLLGNASGGADGFMLRRQHLPHMVEHFATHYPTDVALIEQFILPLFAHLPEYTQLCSTMRAVRSGDAMPKQVRRRSEGTEHVRYKVGQVFRHKRYRYQAVITGWDPQCGAGQEWIQQMGVDRLQRGRHQSFYHVL